MSYFDLLRTASLNGFPFQIANDDEAFGRDIKKHIIVNNKPRFEDVGDRGREFTIEAVIGGNADFIQQAEQFQAILASGTGRLVHPQIGEINGVILEPRRRTNDKEVGIVYFSFTFAEEIKEEQQAQGFSSSDLLSNASATLNAAVIDFTKAYNDRMPDFMSGDIVAQLGAFGANVSTSLSRVGEVLDLGSFDVNDVMSLGGQITSSFQSLLNGLVPKVNFSIGAPKIALPPRDALGITSSLAGVGTNVGDVNPADNSLANSNKTAVAILSKVTVITAAAQASAHIKYESKKQAVEVKGLLSNKLRAAKDICGNNGWDETYIAIGSLLAAINRDIDESIGRLPKTVSIVPSSIRSSLLLSHRLYGDDKTQVIKRSDDIVARNAIIHPSFLPADTLEVLIDA